MKKLPESEVYDFVIIGSGFGGSVSALRLREKGYTVLVMERGKRFEDEHLPKTNWDVRNYLWLPALRCFGILQMSLSRGYFVYHSSGVGGGSLVYAAVLMEPNQGFFEDPSWRKFGDWANILAPHYETAKKMLGVNINPQIWPADEALQAVAAERDYGNTFRATEVGIYFGEPGEEAPDPYFGGEGPARTGCTHCGNCLVGCRVNAKNSLTKNYLYLAEKMGAEIQAETYVETISPLTERGNDSARYSIGCRSSTDWVSPTRFEVRARNVVVSAGVLGTIQLLLHCRDEVQSLPKISQQLGKIVRTNSEAFLGAFCRQTAVDHAKGLSITSIFQADETTQIEPVRFSDGSSMLFRLLSSPLIENGSSFLGRLWATVVEFLSDPGDFFDIKLVPGLAKRGIALMVMQAEDNLMELKLGRNPFAFFQRGLVGEPDPQRTIPINIELGHEVVRSFAGKIGGTAFGSITEGLVNVPMTAHIMGGCTFGETQDSGVVDLDCQVFNYPGLYVIDGSIMSANPGVNPTLTITALAEYAMSRMPAKDR